jgi:hypothetical protein
MSARADIKAGLVAAFKLIDGTGTYVSNLHTNVVGKLIYWDDVPDYPYVCVTVKRETREYLPGNFKWGTLEVPIWVYVKGDDSEQLLENVFTDIETVVDANQELQYSTGKFTEDMSILSFTTDEGLMDPLRIGEILLQVRYGIDS